MKISDLRLKENTSAGGVGSGAIGTTAGGLGNVAYTVRNNKKKRKLRGNQVVLQRYTERREQTIQVYHVTPEVNLPSIKKNGLLPQIGTNSQKIGETDKAVHVFLNQNALEDAMMNWDSMNWQDEEEPELSLITLRVPASMLSEPVTKGVVANQDIAEIHQPIPPSMIVNIAEVY